MSIRICSIMLACGVFAACSGGGTQQNTLPSTPAQNPTAPPPQNAPPAPGTAPPSEQTPSPAPSASAPAATAAGVSHITVVIMENYNFSQMMGRGAAPYLESLARSSALFTNSHGVSHPSEPNYLALFSGSTQGLTSDACPVTYNTANLATELTAKGYTFAGYAENWPGSTACTAAPSSTGSGYLYWRKHAPWVSFSNVPLSDGHTYDGPGTPLTASVNFIVPNICNDMHDCGIAAGDAWLSKNIPSLVSYDNANNGLLIVTFDEGDNDTSNHIVTIMSGPRVNNGAYSQRIDHYSVLRLIETNFGLPLLGASASAQPISGVLH